MLYDLYCFLQVIWKQLYNTESAREHGTLYLLRNLIRRQNVVKHPKNDVNSCEDFFVTVVEAHVLAAAMELLGINPLASFPSSNLIAKDYWLESAEQRHESLMTVCKALVSKFINFTFLATPERKPKQSKDKVFDYTCHLLSLGMFYIEFLDTIHEGDGTRIQRCWRYLLPIFKATGQKKLLPRSIVHALSFVSPLAKYSFSDFGLE